MTYGQCDNASAAAVERLLPMGVAEGCRLVRDVPRDGVLHYDDVVLPPGRLVDALRERQAQEYGGVAVTASMTSTPSSPPRSST